MNLRFAPSPTGSIHIGNFRTLIFVYTYCSFNNLKFICRVDDTDINRNNIENLKEILLILNIFNINYVSYNQMSRLYICNQYLSQMIKNGYVYRCDCIVREDCVCGSYNKVNGAYVLDYKRVVSNNKIEYYDEVYGDLKFNSDLCDLVICRSDGIPLYNFISVVCDIEDNISIIIRGCDHIINTWKQILIYKALNQSIPKFVHLPLIVDQYNKKLSKRSNTTISIVELLRLGYLRSAIRNYVLLLGFSYNNMEYFQINDIKPYFVFDNFNKQNAKYSIEKLTDLNKKHLKVSSYESIISDFVLYITLNGFNSQCINLKYIPKVYNRYSLISQLYNDVYCLSGLNYEKCFDQNISYLYLKIDIVKNMYDLLYSCDGNVMCMIKELCSLFNYQDVHTIFRVITINSQSGIDSTSIYELLGYKEIINRMEKYFSYILKHH